MSGFEWIGDLVRWLSTFVPRLGICKCTQGGVKFRRGKDVKAIRPGLYLWWPLITEIDVIPVTRQVVDLAPQSLTTKDGKSLMVSLVIVYEIDDVVRALTTCDAIMDTISEIGGVSIIETVAGKTFEEICQTVADGFKTEMTRKCRSTLRDFGVKVLEARVRELVLHQVVRVAGDVENRVPISMEKMH